MPGLKTASVSKVTFSTFDYIRCDILHMTSDTRSSQFSLCNIVIEELCLGREINKQYCFTFYFWKLRLNGTR